MKKKPVGFLVRIAAKKWAVRKLFADAEIVQNTEGGEIYALSEKAATDLKSGKRDIVFVSHNKPQPFGLWAVSGDELERTP